MYTVLTRMFVNYTLYDKLALDFWEWLKDTAKPDETFYSTLYQNTKLEGHRNGKYCKTMHNFLYFALRRLVIKVTYNFTNINKY